MQINQGNLAILYKGFRTIFMEALQGAQPQWPQLAMKTTSTKAEEFYKWLGAVPGLQKIVGEIPRSNLNSSGYSIPNDPFGRIVEVPREDIERDSYGVYNPMMAAMGLAAALYPDELMAALLLNGFNTKCYDGKNFFDEGHSPKAKGTAYDNVTDAPLTPEAYVAAQTSIMSRMNAEGRPMNLGRKLVLVVPPQLLPTAKEILQMDFVMKTAANAGTIAAGAAVSNVNKGTAEPMSFGYLASNPDAWFLIEMGQPIKPLIFQEEVPVKLIPNMEETSDAVFNRDVFEYKAYARGNGGYALPELAYGSTGDA